MTPRWEKKRGKESKLRPINSDLTFAGMIHMLGNYKCYFLRPDCFLSSYQRAVRREGLLFYDTRKRARKPMI